MDGLHDAVVAQAAGVARAGAQALREQAVEHAMNRGIGELKLTGSERCHAGVLS
jgi:hypothetical protein